MADLAIGPWLVRGQALALMVGAVAAVWLCGRLAARAGLTRGWAQRSLEAAFLAGVVGARAGHVLQHWPAYAEQPWTALYVWLPGYHPWYGLGAGVAAALLLLRRRPVAERGRGLLAMLAGSAGGLALGAALLATLLAVSPPGPRRDGELPDARLQTLDGASVSTSTLRGRAVVVNVWATWCAPCRREMPLLEEVAAAWAGRGVGVLGVNLAEPREHVARFVAQTGVRYPVWVDPPGAPTSPSRALFDALGGVGLPTTWFVDADGRIRDAYSGELTRAVLEEKLQALAGAGGSHVAAD